VASGWSSALWPMSALRGHGRARCRGAVQGAVVARRRAASCCFILLGGKAMVIKKTRHEWALKHWLTPGATIHRGSIVKIHGNVDSTKHQEQLKQCIFVISSVNVLLL